MNIGINLYCYADENELSLENQALLMKENGFTSTFCFPHKRAASEEGASILYKHGIKFDTLHAPFKNINDMWKDSDKGEVMLSSLINGIDKCVIVGAPVMIVHLSSGIPAPRVNDIGFSRYDRLMDYAEKRNVKIAYENQRFVANIAAVMESYPDAGFCWDVGHEACFAFGRRYMPLFGDRLCALHLHDNHKVFNMDEHLIPFDGKIDYDYIADTLSQVGYTGTLMLELVRSNSLKYSGVSAEDYYKRAADAAKKLKTMVESRIQ